MPLGQVTTDLRIQAIIDPREADRGARAANRAQDSIAQKAVESTRKQISTEGVLVQRLKEEERARKQVERVVDSTERKSSQFGLRGVERIRQQQREQQALLRSLGATEQQIDRITRAYDRMADKAEAATKRASQGGLSGANFSALAGGVTRLAAAAGVGFGLSEVIDFGRQSLQEQARIEQLGRSIDVLAQRRGLNREELRLTSFELQRLGATQKQSLETIQLLTRAGATQTQVVRLWQVALDAAARSGLSVDETVRRLSEAIAKAEPELLDELQIVIKLSEVFGGYAQKLGVSNANALTAAQRSRALVRELSDQAEKGGEYAATLGTISERLLKVNQEQARAKENLGKIFAGTASDGAQAYLEILERINTVLVSIGQYEVNQKIQRQLEGTDRGPSRSKIATGRDGVSLERNVAQSVRLRRAFGFEPGAVTPQLEREEAELNVARARLFFGQSPELRAQSKLLIDQPAKLGLSIALGFEEALEARQTAEKTGKKIGEAVERFTFQSPGFVREADALREIARRPTEESLRFRRTILGGRLVGGPTLSVQPDRQFFELTPVERLLSSEANSTAEDGLRGGRDFMQDFRRRLEEEEREVERQNERIFSSLKSQSGDLFDAMIAGGSSFWNYWKNLGLTAMRDVFSSAVASQLMGLTGGRGPAGALGLPFGGFGSIARPGAPGGTGGFAGPVNLSGYFGGITNSTGLGATAARGAGAGSALGIAGALNPALLGFAGAFAASKIPTRGNRVLGASFGALSGGLGAGSALAFSPALLGLLGVPGANIFVGAGIGVGALIGALSGGAKREAKKEVRRAYGVDVRDEGILRQIIEVGKSTGGNLAVAVQTPAVRELVTLYKMATGQGAGPDAPRLQTGVLLTQRGGQLFQSAQYANGAPTLVQSRLPTIGVRPTQTVNVIHLDAQTTRAVLAEAAMEGIARSPQLVADAGYRAAQSSFQRRKQAALLHEPFTAVGS